MAKYLLSKSAVADIEKIADYTISNFGLNQARLYRDGLISCFQYLTERPEIGRPYLHKDAILLLRYRYKAHIVFFKRTSAGILIVCILGERMDFNRHLSSLNKL